MGYDVSLPLTESASYDLIVDTGSSLKRIQVKYSSQKDVDLRCIHSNSKGYVVKKTLTNAYDWLYILKPDDSEYLIKNCLESRRSIRPNSANRINQEKTVIDITIKGLIGLFF